MTKKDCTDEQFGKFLKLLKKLHINLPFIEALSQMANSVKFLKEILANKPKLDDLSHVELNVVCSAILQNKLPNKLKDPESFTIPCLIHHHRKPYILSIYTASRHAVTSTANAVGMLLCKLVFEPSTTSFESLITTHAHDFFLCLLNTTSTLILMSGLFGDFHHTGFPFWTPCLFASSLIVLIGEVCFALLSYPFVDGPRAGNYSTSDIPVE